LSTPVYALVMSYDIPVLSNQMPVINIVIKQEQEPEKKPKLYTIKKGDNLTKIAKTTGSSVGRLWAANPKLTNPDRIEPKTVLKVPDNDEVLPEREMPVTIVVDAKQTQVSSKPSVSGGFSSAFDIAPAGWYPVGQCTQYVWSRRAVGKWGNANQWVYNAQRDGVATGYIPRVGAVGQQGNHVVYVEAVDGNKVYISERNFDWNGSYRERWADASDFIYIF
jgi:surface antigen